MPTTIQIKDETLERLKFFKEFRKESYDEIINKLIDGIEEGELTESTIRDIEEGLRDVKAGRTQPIEEVAKELGIRL